MQNAIKLLYKGSEQPIIDALYTEQILHEFRGNPLIEALPPILEEEQIVQYCSVFPQYDERERELDASYRFHCVQRLFQYFQPFEKHLDLEQRISRTIRQGYLSRNPFNRQQVMIMHESYRSLKAGEFLDSYNIPIKRTAHGFTIIGLSGIGKTTALERILSYYPQLIQHREYEGEAFQFTQISWLKLDCPYDGSVKGLCISFFSELDRLLGTNYFKKFGTRRNTVDVMLQHMTHLASLHAIGILIIDEIQHLNLSKSGGSDKMLNFFVTLVNTIGIPVVMVGTNKAISILQSEFRQARRGSGQGDMVWGQMPKDDTWDLFVEGMWDYQWMKFYTPLTEEINELLYEESQGIIDIAVKLFMISQLRAISTGTEKITLSLMKQVAKDSLRLVRPMLQALKSGIPSEIAKYEDIRPIDLHEEFEKYKSSIDLHEKVRIQKKIQESKRKSKGISITEEIVLFLLSMDIEIKVAQRIADAVIKKHSEDLDRATAIKEAMKLVIISEESIKKESVTSIERKNVSSNVLCLLAKEAKKKKLSVYEHFLNKGIIKQPLKEVN
ncbi:MAG: ATP-binding protein [Bacillus paranthracis]|nr:ATP-binding protein [Bacillus paranthracis]